MTDRELLELAAKAAGLGGFRYCENWRGMAEWIESDGGWFGGRSWNPLRDDGDALRLAVKFGLRVDVADEDVRAEYGLRTCGRVGIASEPHGDNVCASTRRAIVRAAAEIGKGMA